MARIQKLLLFFFVASIVVSLTMVLLYETNILLPGIKEELASQKFVVAVIMELVTVVFIPLALYLFKISFVSKSLVMRDGKTQLLRWGLIRMAMLCIPMMLNTFFYYFFGLEVSFGYLAIILFLCLFMIYPSMNRCLAETASPEADDASDVAQQP